MAGDWIKIEHSLTAKPEVMQMACELGVSEFEIVGHLVAFWSWVDQNMSPNCPAVYGTESGLNRVAGRDGFVRAMVSCGWLEFDGHLLSIPNYEEHLSQSAKQRGLEAKKKRRQREKASPNCPGARGTEGGTREEKRREEKEEDISVAAQPHSAKAEAMAADVRNVIGHYQTYHPRALPKPSASSKEWKLIAARLKEDFTAEDLCVAIDGCHASPFHCGENPGGTKYQSLDLIMRDAAHVTKFIEAAESSADPVLSEKTRRTIRAGQQWLESEQRKDAQ